MVKATSEKSKTNTLDKVLPYILIICGILGLLAAFTLTYDKIQVLKNPAYDPPCNINPIFSCGSIMKTEQASLLGVPNTIFGIMGYTALVTFGALMLSGAKFKKWVWQIAQVAAAGGLFFMGYLFFQGVFRIGAICPWCFLTWMVTIPVFLYVSLYNLRHDTFSLPPKLKPTSEWAQENHLNILISTYVIVFGILLWQFWYYWQTLI